MYLNNFITFITLFSFLGFLTSAFAETPTGPEFLINTYTTDSQDSPSVATLSGGGFVVTWQSDGQDGSGSGIYGQLYNSSGTSVGSEFLINTYTTNAQRVPSVAALSDGGFVVTWQSDGQDGDNYGVYGQRYNSSGIAVGSEFLINTYTASDQRWPSVAALSDGGFVVTWTSDGQDGDYDGVYGQLYNSSGTSVGGEFLINTYTTNAQRVPSVAALSDGGFVVAWMSYDQDGDTWGVYGQRYNSSGIAVSSEFLINTYTTFIQSEPSVAALSDGGFVVTWDSVLQDGSAVGIYGQLYNSSGTSVGNEFLINTYTTDSQDSPSVAALSGGGFVVTWKSDGQDGSGSGIYGQLYNSSGTSVGSEFLINTYTTDSQDSPSVAALSGGGFVVTWKSDGQDGSNAGVYGQRFTSAASESIPTLTEWGMIIFMTLMMGIGVMILSKRRMA